MKRITLSSIPEAVSYEEELQATAKLAKENLEKIASSLGSLEFLESLKFNPVGFDPLDGTRELNLIEQINQTFTYLASFRAARILFTEHQDVLRLHLNLGTLSGSDIESDPKKLIACEVFSATHPRSNNKLNKDIRKVLETEAEFKYVFFMCPNIKAGIYERTKVEGVVVWSLGL